MVGSATQASIYVGTSGWHYKHWRTKFYPEKSATREWLSIYTRYFNTVELNNVFYRFPTERAVELWRDSAPEGFLFAVKANRFMTHRKKLLDAERLVKDLLDRVSLLGPKLGPILFQLPPRWRANPERLIAFAEWLPRKGFDFVFEFRESSWHADEVLRVLSERNLSLCLHDWPAAKTPPVITGKVAYIRLHGPEKAYAGKYTSSQLRPWIERIRSWRKQVERIFVYFNNDQEAYAVQNARQLKRALEKC
jgi:uncharacterized protein YecE (DUF72 family)